MNEIFIAIYNEPIWFFLLLLYLVIIFVSFLPVWRAYAEEPDREKIVTGNRLDELKSSKLSPTAQKEIEANYLRIAGALAVWQKEAKQAKSFYQYALFWTTVATPLVPILTQFVDEKPLSRLFLTVVSLHIAIVVAFQRTIKPNDMTKAFRQNESEFYDLYRRVIERPESFGSDDKTLLVKYFEEVERVRQNARMRELAQFDARSTDSGTGTSGGGASGTTSAGTP
jgi:hypothetical protein